MAKVPAPVAGVIAKAASFPDEHPQVYIAVLVLVGAMLIIDALTPDEHRDA